MITGKIVSSTIRTDLKAPYTNRKKKYDYDQLKIGQCLELDFKEFTNQEIFLKRKSINRCLKEHAVNFGKEFVTRLEDRCLLRIWRIK